MTHERFVHLSQEEKNTIIIRTMEIIVELESKYDRELKSSGHSSERLQKYVQMLNKLRSFLISEAAAAVNYPKMGEDFEKLLNGQGKKACIYGGWVSEFVTIDGNSFCKHPSMVNNPKIREAYKSANDNCVGPNNITCNPMIFGYKTSKDEKRFCVDTGYATATKNKSHNSFYHPRIGIQFSYENDKLNRGPVFNLTMYSIFFIISFGAIL